MDILKLFKTYKNKFGWFEDSLDIEKDLITASELIFLFKKQKIKLDHKALHQFREKKWIYRVKAGKSPAGTGKTSYYHKDVYFNIWALNEIKSIMKKKEIDEYVDYFKEIATKDLIKKLKLEKMAAKELAIFVWPKYFSGEVFTNLKHFKIEEFIDLLAELLKKYELLAKDNLVPEFESINVTKEKDDKVGLHIPLNKKIYKRLRERLKNK